MEIDHFEEWWKSNAERKQREYQNAIKHFAKSAYAAGMKRSAEIADKMDAPKSIGQDHGRHHRAGIQRVARAIREEIGK